MEKYYTTKQVAEILGLAPFTIRKYVREGKLKAERIGGQREIIRISESELKRFMNR